MNNKIKIISIISAITVLLFSCTRNKPSCYLYHNGKFVYHGITKNKSSFMIKIIRNDSLQIEIDSKTNDTGFMKVEWIDSCSYRLKFIKTAFNQPDSMVLFNKKMVITSTIIKGTDRYYICKSTYSLLPYSITDTIWISQN